MTMQSRQLIIPKQKHPQLPTTKERPLMKSLKELKKVAKTNPQYKSPNQEMTLADYRKQVEQCLIVNEGCTEQDAKDWMETTWEEPLANGAKDAEDVLLMCYEEGSTPRTVAAILVA